MRRQGNGGHTGIRNSNIRQAIHAKIRVDHATLFTGEHCTGRRGMELCARRPTQPLYPLFVGLDGRTR